MDSHPKRSRAGPAAALVIALLLPVFYVLSLGPAVYLAKATDEDPRLVQAIVVFYAPLQWLHDETPLREPLDAYVDFWKSLP